MKIEDILKSLEDEGVQYAVVGGVAVVLYGYVRFTKDIDLVLDFSSDNVVRLVRALASLHFEPGVPVNPMDLANPAKRDEWLREKNAQAITFFNRAAPLLQIDVLLTTTLSCIKSVRRRVGDLEISLISFEDLVKMKTESGRDIDRIDVEKLKQLRGV